MKRMIKPEAQHLISDQKALLAPLNSSTINALISTHGADDGIPKYKVMVLIRLYLFAGVLQGFFTSLRGIVTLQNNILAQWFVGLKTWSLNGLSGANKRVPFTVYKDIYDELSKQIDSPLSRPRISEALGTFEIFDGTYLKLCLKLVPWAKKQNRRAGKGQMLMSTRISDSGLIPNCTLLDSNPAHCEVHFEKLIMWTKKGITYLFDRGYRCIEIFIKIHNSGNFFITRWNQSVSVEVVKNLLFCSERQGDIKILHDQQVRLGKKKRKSGPIFRLVSAISYRDGKETLLYFLTNRFDLTAFEVAEIYLHRWQIETFFKWLKSHLKLTHFISYSENGVYSQIYITLILNLLLINYHQTKQLKSQFGINTQRSLMNEMINSIVIEIVIEVFDRALMESEIQRAIPPPNLELQQLMNP